MVENPLSLAGKKYLVTGASSGIGQAAAIMISKMGGRVVLNGRNEQRLNDTLAQLEGEGHHAMPFDLEKSEGIKDYVKQCVAVDNTKLDGMVHAAGVGRDVPIRAEKLEYVERMMRIVYYSYFELLKEGTTKRVMNEGGSIVAFSSICVSVPLKSKANYSSAKAAIEMTSRIAAQEMAPRRIRVNVIQPALTKTSMTQEIFSRLEQELAREYPLGFLTAEDVANMVAFLLSDMSNKITGQSILMSGGRDTSPSTIYSFA